VLATSYWHSQAYYFSQIPLLLYTHTIDAELRQRARTLDGNGPQLGGSDSLASSSSSSEGGAGEQRPHVSDAVLEQRQYFSTVTIAYVVGLLAAFAANSITHMGQPGEKFFRCAAPF